MPIGWVNAPLNDPPSPSDIEREIECTITNMSIGIRTLGGERWDNERRSAICSGVGHIRRVLDHANTLAQQRRIQAKERARKKRIPRKQGLLLPEEPIDSNE